MSGEKALTVTQEVRRQRIVNAAIDCLAREGWVGTTMASIAAEAGISRGLISYHFGKRNDLHQAVLESVVETVFAAGSARMQDKLELVSTARDKLAAYIVENLGFIREHRREMAALGQILPHLRGHDGAARFGPAEEDLIISGTAALFEYGISTGEFREADPKLLALVLRRSIDAAAVKSVEDDDFDLDAYARELAALFLRGVQA